MGDTRDDALVGEETIVDAAGCDAERLRAPEILQAVMSAVIDDLGLKVVGAPQWHRFGGPGGVTGLYLLSESHLAVHTYPEVGVATFNLYCCRSRPAWPWEERLAALLGATKVTVRRVTRGAGA